MEARLTRLAKNEALFREVNERISEISQELAPGAANPELIDGLICECSDQLCLERVGPLTIAEYEGIRQDPRRFIIAAGPWGAQTQPLTESGGFAGGSNKCTPQVGAGARPRDARAPPAVNDPGLGSASVYSPDLQRDRINEPYALELGLYPFVPGDTFKLYIAAVLLPSAWRLVERTTSL